MSATGAKATVAGQYVQEAEEAFARAREALKYAESPGLEPAQQAEAFQVVQAETNLGLLAARIGQVKLLQARSFSS